mmetsp:Transcript_17851/g.52106  ORF Transcript_17851/g.52106 Transcript_17851/m.52106 type:complete len:432 (-) Transcript_17851:98-1393(-)
MGDLSLLVKLLGVQVLVMGASHGAGLSGPVWVWELQYLCLAVASVLCAVGLLFLGLFYIHTALCIFNRLPRLATGPLSAYWSLFRPLETLFRLATAPFRVLPDVLVVGEVRCGTTSLCDHLTRLPGCHTPFCPWRHPELDNKETFFFAGHYLGLADPSLYAMCFPLALTRWFHRWVLGRPFFTFDGCAQYLTSPVAPWLIAEAYAQRGLPPPVIVACTRDPVSQAVSWWRYENNAMAWGEGMGLREWNTALRGPAYPPRSISGAFEYACSPEMDRLYTHAEAMVREQLERRQFVVLPRWAISWPGGQLAGIGRNGHFQKNITRFNTALRSRLPAFGGVQRVPLEELTTPQRSAAVLAEIFKNMQERWLDVIGPSRVQVEWLELRAHLSSTVHETEAVKRNPGAKLHDPALEPTEKELANLRAFFNALSSSR